MRIRKQDYELTLANLMQFPAWEYALDEEGSEGQNERTVKPYQVSPPLDPHHAYFIVRASFHLADGAQLKGYIKPIILGKTRLMEPLIPIDMNPIIVTDSGRVVFWYGVSKPNPKEIAENYRILNKRPSDVFPLRFASDINVLNSITEGTLEGFLHCDKRVKNFFNLKPIDIKVVK